MAAALDPSAYKEVMLVLGAAAVVVPLVHRWRVSPVLGFLVMGALIGPHLLGRIAAPGSVLSWFTVGEVDQIAYLAELGVVFLLFMIGLELSFERLWTLRRILFGMGAAQVVATAAVIAAAGLAAGLGRTEALVIGAALALSSTAIVVQVLADEHRLGSNAGRATFAVLIFQDLAVVPLLFLLTVLGARRAGGIETVAFDVLTLVAQAVGVLAAILLAGRYLLRPLFRMVAQTGNREFFMAACLLVVIGAGFAASAGGQSMALGAFLAGLLLAETEYRREIEVTIEPFKGLLLGVFFFSVGSSVDWGRIVASPGLVFGALAGLLAVKFAVVYALARAFRFAKPASLETAAMLATGGEFAFVLVNAALARQLVGAEAGQIVLVVAALSMALVPVIGRIVARVRPLLAPKLVDPTLLEAPPDEKGPRAIVGGYGRVGELISSILTEHKIDHFCVDSDPALVGRRRREQKALYYGDLSRPEFLRACHIETASALILTIDAPAKIEAVVKAARDIRPDLPIICRARDGKHAHKLYELGVAEAVPETVEASLQLGEAALVGLGKPMGLVLASIHERRDQFKREFQRLAPEERTSVARQRSLRKMRGEKVG